MKNASERLIPRARSDFRHFREIQPRWNDNDVYGHINNAVYYFYFDTLINNFLIENKALDIAGGDVIGLVAQTGCSFFEGLEYPNPIDAGLSVTKIGRSSVTYEIGLFGRAYDHSAALGHFVHVYVDRNTRRPVALPATLRELAEKIVR